MSQRQTPSPNRAPIKLRTVSAKASTSNLTVTNVFAQPQLLHSGNGESIESPSASQENGDTSVVDNRKRSPSVSSNYDQRQDDRSPSPSKRIQIPRLGRASNKNSPVASFEERESRLARKSSLGWLKEIARKASKDSLNAVPRDLPLLTAEPMPIELTNEPADGLPVILSSSPKEETIAPELSTDLSSPPNVPEVQVQPSSPPVQSLDKIVSTPSASPLTPDPKSSSTTAPVAPSSSSSSWFKSVRKSSLPRPQATQPTTKTSSSPTRAFTISTTSSPARSSIPRFTPPSSPGTPTPSLPVTKKDSPAITHPSKGSPASPSPSDDLPPKRKVTLSLRRPSSPISNKKLVKSSIPAPISISGSSKTAEVVMSINSPLMEPLPPRRDMPTSATNNNLNVQASIDSILHNPNQVDHPPISSSSLSAPSSALPDNSQAQEPVTQIQDDSTPSENSSEQTPSIVTEPPVPSTPSKTTSAPPPAARTSSPALSIPKGWFSSIRPNSPKSPSVKGKEKEKDKSEEPNKSAESNVTSQPDVPALSSDGQPTSASPSVVTGSSSSPSATKVEEPVAAETPTAAVSTLTATSDMISTDAPAPIIDNPAPIPTPSQDNTIAEPVVPQVAVSPAPAQSSRGWFGLYKSGSSRPASIKGKAKEEPIKENVQDESAGQGGEVPETKTVNEVKTQGDDTPQPSSSKEEPPVPPSTAHVGTEVVSEDASNRDPSTAKSEPEVVPIDQNVGSISSPNTPPVSRGWFGSYKVNPNSNSNVSLSKPAPPPTKLKEEVVVEVKNDNSAVENTPVEPQQPLEPVSPKPDINVSHPPIAITGNSKSEEPHVPRPSIASSPVYRGWFGSSTPTKSKQMSGVADENGKSRVTTETPKDVGPLMNEDTGPTASTTRPMETSSSQDTQVNSHQETSISGDAGSRLPVTTTPVSLPASNLNGTLPSARYTLGLPLLGRRLKRGNVEEKASTGAATEIESPMQRRDGEVDSIKGSIGEFNFPFLYILVVCFFFFWHLSYVTLFLPSLRLVQIAVPIENPTFSLFLLTNPSSHGNSTSLPWLPSRERLSISVSNVGTPFQSCLLVYPFSSCNPVSRDNSIASCVLLLHLLFFWFHRRLIEKIWRIRCCLTFLPRLTNRDDLQSSLSFRAVKPLRGYTLTPRSLRISLAS
ncbi:hypothetical protein FRC02_001916 [Tulasnella sp. 418]|nr:hypothetical protein FRC02_001916 [Tulasnella sp. 418]